MSGRLYLCATPIGNLSDITLRVIETLKSVDLIAAEDTRNTIKLLNYFDIKTTMTSYHEHNKYDKAKELVCRLLEGKDIALVTDAGTPGISDPGEELVKEAYAAGVEVTSLPGACALPVALSLSGLSSRRFVFEGFLPADKKERAKALKRLDGETRTIVLYEAPHRVIKTLEELYAVLGGRNIRICRELTKIHESVLAFTIEEAITYFKENEPRGEMVLVIEGADERLLEEEARASFKEMSTAEHVQMYMDKGLSQKEAMKQAAADRGVSKRDIYSELKIRDHESGI